MKKIILMIFILGFCKFAFAALTISNVKATPKIDSVVISWDLSAKGTGQVEYGTAATYGLTSQLESSFKYDQHSQEIKGLFSNTIYHYRVKSKDQAGVLSTSADFNFKTLANPCTPIENSCNAPPPPCGAITTGTDNCGKICTKTGVPCTQTEKEVKLKNIKMINIQAVTSPKTAVDGSFDLNVKYQE